MQCDIRLEDILKLIISLSWGVPLLSRFNMQPLMPIAFITESSRESRLVMGLVPRQRVIHTRTSQKEISDKLIDSEALPLLFLGDNKDNPSKRENELVSFLVSVIRAGVCEKKEVNSLAVGIFEKHIPQQFQQSFFKIYIQDCEDYHAEEVAAYKDLLFCETMIRKDKVERLLSSHNECIPMLSALKASIELAQFACPEIDTISLAQIAEQLVTLDEERNDTDDLIDLFLDDIYKEAENGRVSLFDLPNLEAWQIDQLGTAVFADKAYLYISEQRFSQLVSGLRCIYPIDIIKYKLVEAGIIKGSGETSYSTKMGYITPYGEYKRVRMIKLAQDSLVKIGDVPFLDLCRLNNNEKANVSGGIVV